MGNRHYTGVLRETSRLRLSQQRFCKGATLRLASLRTIAQPFRLRNTGTIPANGVRRIARSSAASSNRRELRVLRALGAIINAASTEVSES